MEHLGLQLLDLQQTMNQNSNNEFKVTDDAASKTSTDQGLVVQNWVKLTFGGGWGVCALYFSDTILWIEPLSILTLLCPRVPYRTICNYELSIWSICVQYAQPKDLGKIYKLKA